MFRLLIHWNSRKQRVVYGKSDLDKEKRTQDLTRCRSSLDVDDERLVANEFRLEIIDNDEFDSYPVDDNDVDDCVHPWWTGWSYPSASILNVLTRTGFACTGQSLDGSAVL